MISHKYKCIFIHIPKTGGTSIEKVIWPNKEDRTTENLWCNRKDAPSLNPYQDDGLQHLLAKYVKQVVGEPTFNEYYKFSVVRNPWDKVVSQFEFQKMLFYNKKKTIASNEPDQILNFEGYIEFIQNNSSIQSKPQYCFIENDEGLQLVDDIFKFENINNILNVLADKISLPKTFEKIPHLKKSNRQPYRSYYNIKTKNIIGDLYYKDIEKYKYSY